jgi:hypothetical protein
VDALPVCAGQTLIMVGGYGGPVDAISAFFDYLTFQNQVTTDIARDIMTIKAPTTINMLNESF